jgi:arylsulfatase A-like enzyme
MKRILGIGLVFLAAGLSPAPASQDGPPNIVVIYADDLGYGDLGCTGATRVRTPQIDRIAAEGLRFTDGHSPSATCTPSRYALLTGEYAWRRKGTNILPGDAALIIEPGRPTLASILKEAGYATGVVGKWHLGLGDGRLDWNGEIRPGPLEIGFDFAFLMPATGDRVPCVYVENRRVVGLDPSDPIRVSYGRKVGDEPTGKENPELLRVKLSKGHDGTIVNGISRIGFMAGGEAARWVDEDISDVFARKAVEFMERHGDRPFFLFLSTHDIHVPRVPHRRFAGTSGCGVRGDVIHQFDALVGEVAGALDRLGLARRTLLIITSDNGPVLDDGYADGAVEDLAGHRPAGPLRGGKYSLYEGGTRVPFIARWPGRIRPGVSDALVCQVDFMASFAALAGRPLVAGAAPDSFDVLAALLGDSPKGRDHLVEHAGGVALRKGTWKYIPPRGKGAGELYNLAEDLGETKNLAGERPDLVRELDDFLEKLRAAGRSRP